MTFFLSISTLLYDALTTRGTKYIMANIEGYELFDTVEESEESPEQTVARYNAEELDFRSKILTVIKLVFPRRFLVILALMVIFMLKYYYFNCIRADDGSWYSRDLFYPSKHIHPLGALFGLYSP